MQSFSVILYMKQFFHSNSLLRLTSNIWLSWQQPGGGGEGVSNGTEGIEGCNCIKNDDLQRKMC